MAASATTSEIPTSTPGEWNAERLGWAVMVLIVGAATGGVIARGPLSSRSAMSDDGTLRIAFESVAHLDSPEQVILDLAPKDRTPSLRVTLSRSFLDDLTRIEWTPPPADVSTTDERAVYQFAASGDQCRLILRFRHDSWGRKSCNVRCGEESTVTFTQYVLP
jgi:hypothetical protein